MSLRYRDVQRTHTTKALLPGNLDDGMFGFTTDTEEIGVKDMSSVMHYVANARDSWALDYNLGVAYLNGYDVRLENNSGIAIGATKKGWTSGLNFIQCGTTDPDIYSMYGFHAASDFGIVSNGAYYDGVWKNGSSTGYASLMALESDGIAMYYSTANTADSTITWDSKVDFKDDFKIYDIDTFKIKNSSSETVFGMSANEFGINGPVESTANWQINNISYSDDSSSPPTYDETCKISFEEITVDSSSNPTTGTVGMIWIKYKYSGGSELDGVIPFSSLWI